MNLNLHGIIPPVITPLLEQNRLDEEGLVRLLDHVMDGGVHGVFMLGTTGEGPGLSYELRRQVIRLTCAHVRGRTPVTVCITDTAFSEAVSIAGYAAEQGADAVVTAPPYYFPAGQPELIEYVHHLAARLPLPLLLYNMPSLTKVRFEPETIRELSGMDGIIGIKDSSGDHVYLFEVLKLMKDRKGFCVLAGTEELLAEAVLAGAAGGVCGGANVRPDLYIGIYRAAVEGDLGRLDSLRADLFRFRKLYGFGGHWSSAVKGIKCALNLMGVCSDYMAEPFHRFREPERMDVKAHLKKTGLI